MGCIRILSPFIIPIQNSMILVVPKCADLTVRRCNGGFCTILYSPVTPYNSPWSFMDTSPKGQPFVCDTYGCFAVAGVDILCCLHTLKHVYYNNQLQKSASPCFVLVAGFIYYQV